MSDESSKEIWKDIPDFEGFYQASNLGRLRSVNRITNRKDGTKVFSEGKILNPALSYGYPRLHICKHGVRKPYFVHQLIAISFLKYNLKNKELSVDHIDGNKENNKITNLQILTKRENTSKHFNYKLSDYRGVSWNTKSKKWVSNICIKGKRTYLGSFTDEHEAGKAYLNKLKEVENI
jgi:NUMOD4 motif/HNH endonuclease/AP2 domain